MLLHPLAQGVLGLCMCCFCTKQVCCDQRTSLRASSSGLMRLSPQLVGLCLLRVMWMGMHLVISGLVPPTSMDSHLECIKVEVQFYFVFLTRAH